MRQRWCRWLRKRAHERGRHAKQLHLSQRGRAVEGRSIGRCVGRRRLQAHAQVAKHQVLQCPRLGRAIHKHLLCRSQGGGGPSCEGLRSVCKGRPKRSDAAPPLRVQRGSCVSLVGGSVRQTAPALQTQPSSLELAPYPPPAELAACVPAAPMRLDQKCRELFHDGAHSEAYNQAARVLLYAPGGGHLNLRAERTNVTAYEEADHKSMQLPPRIRLDVLLPQLGCEEASRAGLQRGGSVGRHFGAPELRSFTRPSPPHPRLQLTRRGVEAWPLLGLGSLVSSQSCAAAQV